MLKDLPRNDPRLVENYYWNIVEAFPDALFEEDMGEEDTSVFRFKQTKFARWVGDRIDFNELLIACQRGDVETELVVQFYQDIGYSLCGFVEIWGEYLKEILDDLHTNEKASYPKELVCNLCNRLISLDREGLFYLHHKAEENYLVCPQSNKRPEKFVVANAEGEKETIDTVNLQTGRKVKEENDLEEYMKGHRRTVVSSQPFPTAPMYLSTESPLTKREEIAKSNLAALIIKFGIFDETYNRRWLVEKAFELADMFLEVGGISNG